MSSIFEDQKRFMELGGQVTDGSNPKQLTRYLAHLEEEVEETVTADTEVELIDGLVDTIVVAIGALWSLGIYPQAAWDAVCAANMRKHFDAEGNQITVFREDGQVGKPTGWIGPEYELRKLIEERDAA